MPTLNEDVTVMGNVRSEHDSECLEVFAVSTQRLLL